VPFLFEIAILLVILGDFEKSIAFL
jgi:hypothetical protein